VVREMNSKESTMGDPEMVYYQDATPTTSVTEIGRNRAR